MNKNILLYLISLLLSVSQLSYTQNYLHANGKKIVDGNDQEVYLKGIGLGGWLLQEGYMLKTPYSIMGAEHEIRNEIAKLVGEEKTAELYSIYHKNYVREIDIQNIAKWGFNSIRLPFHWAKLVSTTSPLTFSEEGFQVIDSLLSWCEKNEIYLILDMHAAPGGESDEAISDYDKTKPSLWESDENKTLTVELWKEIAKRYSDKEWIGGYDLINEPKWDLGTANQPLRDLYIKITDSIRTVDTNHILFVEGNWYATDFNGLTPPWDDNMAYSFHRYWNSNDQGTINYLVNIKNTYNIPLWLGETGENSNAWFLDCVKLMKKNDIGWAWWPHKKIDNVVGPLSAPMYTGYQKLLDYWNGNGSKPSELYAYSTLLGQFENLKFEKCSFQPGVIDALFRQEQETTSKPFKDLSIPGRIFVTDYDLGSRMVSYSDVDYENTQGQGNAAWNSGGKYRNDGVDIEVCSDTITNGFNVGWIETGEWLKFTVNVLQDGNYDLKIRTSANETGGKLVFALDGSNLTETIDVPLTNGWQNWKTTNVGNYFLSAGKHEITLKFYFTGYNFNYFEFTNTTVGVKTDNKIPTKVKLLQNYPNPFNPSTTIDFTVPSFAEKSNTKNLKTSTNVELTVFDVLGREIAELVNEKKVPGNYSVTFNANSVNKHLASGTYFYKLEVGDFSETKKMILLN